IRASKIDGPRVPLTVGPARRGCAAVSEEGVTLARAKKSEKPDGAAWQRPVAGILLSAVAVIAFLGLSSYGPRAQANWAGPVGHQVAGALLESIGAGAYAAALFLFVVAATLIAGKPRFTFSRGASWLLLSLSVVALLDLSVHARVHGHSAGGVLGATIAGAARAALSTWGAAVVIAAVGAAALVVATDLWALRAALAAGRV